MKNKGLGILACLACYFIWGGLSPVIVKIIPIEGPLISFFGIFFGCLFSWIPFKNKSFKEYDKETWRNIIVASIAGACVFIFSHLAYQATSIATVVLLFATMPFITNFVVGPIFGFERPSAKKSVYLGLGFVGLLVAFFGPIVLNIGVVYSLIAAISFAIYNVMMKFVEDKVKPVDFIFFSMLIGMNFCWMFNMLMYYMGALTFEGFALLLNPVYSLALIVFGFVNFAFANWLYLYASKNTSLTIISSLGYSEPFWGILIGFLLFGEAVTIQFLLGISLVLYSGYRITK